MKILIVDDEELTRTGLATSIDWNALHIDEILQADDGVNGLEAALRHKPEIVLCDVRMPRMDGIAMMERIQNLLPDTIPVFMSGYSDKEYLKAAIKLRAVNYIEKPLNPKEVCETILEAQRTYHQKQHSHHAETISSIETASQLAHQLTIPYRGGEQAERLWELTGRLDLQFGTDACCTSLILNLNTASEFHMPPQQELYLPLRKFLKSYRLDCIYTAKRTHFLVYFLFGSDRPSDTALRAIADYLGRLFSSYGSYYIAVGDTFRDMTRAYQSYASAVVLLQSSYFFPENSCLTSGLLKGLPARTEPLSPTFLESRFTQLLLNSDQENTGSFLDGLYRTYEKNTTVLANQVKDIYYKLFLALEDARRQRQIAFVPEPKQENIVDALENSFSFDALHSALVQRTQRYFTEIPSAAAEHPTIFTIKEFIGKNYANETLSVKDISDHVFLSTSYVCTFFKNETGKTLNQYLTEYRMEKAKELLRDPRYKITDVSAKVGYSDGNYFGKSFKKYSGFSPSEYREKMS